MSDPTARPTDPAHEPLDARSTEQWWTLSTQMARANAGRQPGRINDQLAAAAAAEPQSPLAPAYWLWSADNLAREQRFAEAIRAFDAAIGSAQSARRLVAQVDPIRCALVHKAQAAGVGGDAGTAIATYKELAARSDEPAEPLFQAGLVAESTGDDDQAAALYGYAASPHVTPRTDDPAQLARRALHRLAAGPGGYQSHGPALAEVLATALEARDIATLAQLLGRSHFAVGPLGGHLAFAEPDLLEHFYRDLLDSTVTVRRHVTGSGGKLYLRTAGWTGNWYRGEVICQLTRAPKGWQWTGVVLTEVPEMWLERWRPLVRQTNQPIPLPLLAPWPAGQSFKAGGLTEFIAQQAAVVLSGGILAAALSRNPCGFGPRGFYYNQGSTHREEDAFAIDFTRYEPNEPYNPESGGTRVLAVHDGVVVNVQAGISSGDSSAANLVEINHADPANPTVTNRFRSRYLHLEGPFRIPVSPMMLVITGQRLGFMDDTGNSVLDHLHFSIHDRNISHPNVSFGRSVRPSPLNGTRLEDGDSGTCVRSSNVERFPGLNFEPTVVSFGSVAVGQVATRTLTAKNNAGGMVTFSLQASPAGSVFQWAAASGTLANGAETSFTLTFRPVSNAIARTTLRVTSTAPGSPHEVGLVGKGPGGFPPPNGGGTPDSLDIHPNPVNFGSVSIGTVATRTLTIENQTGRTVNVSFPAGTGVFFWSTFSGSLAHGTSRGFELSFRPASNAIAHGQLLVTSDAAGSPQPIGLIGKGPGGF
jgi:Peptidase family M23/Abnormal spindle-like microcephaly-assoc'd, ASPM-SPD-2-Hydin